MTVRNSNPPPPTRMVKRDRLPTLQEVLSRNTRPPVDLYCYYLFLQREGSEDMLDFWLDVHQHENLVRAYFKDLAKNGRSVKEEWPRYYDIAKKRGSAWNGLNGVTQDASSQHAGDDSRDGDHTRETTVNNEQSEWMANNSNEAVTAAAGDARKGRDTLTAEDINAAARDMQRTPSPTSNGPRPNLTANFSPTLRALYPHDREEQMSPPSPSQQEFATASSKTTAAAHGRRSIGGIASSLRGKKSSAMPYIPRDSAITRTDLVASAERIYMRYLMPGAEKEIYLPNVLRINSFPISSSQIPQTYPEPDYDLENDTLARVPDMFHSQKEWVYRAMEQDSFPRFLRSKAFGNLTPISAMIRLVLGLLLMWIALSTAFSFIFLDVKPKSKRLWVSRAPLVFLNRTSAQTLTLFAFSLCLSIADHPTLLAGLPMHHLICLRSRSADGVLGRL